ncbi:hypothetical protein LCGC14_2592390 [marine sediment metagenome]|uniref:Uncharacterized protein n=1 Tax=marine sediment metagenome TaxID=412755 RepID=A0A0F9AZ70_9ZZZZ
MIFDGDQKRLQTENIKHAFKMTERSDVNTFDVWIKERITYLPGDKWPERWLVQESLNNLVGLSLLIGIDEGELRDICNKGLSAGKHNEFYEIGCLVGLTTEDTLNRFCIHVAQNNKQSFADVILAIESRLEK